MDGSDGLGQSNCSPELPLTEMGQPLQGAGWEVWGSAGSVGHPEGPVGSQLSAESVSAGVLGSSLSEWR